MSFIVYEQPKTKPTSRMQKFLIGGTFYDPTKHIWTVSTAKTMLIKNVWIDCRFNIYLRVGFALRFSFSIVLRVNI